MNGYLYLAAAAAALALADRALAPFLTPLAALLAGYGAGRLLHGRRRWVAGYAAMLAGAWAAIWLAPLRPLEAARPHLAAVAFGLFLNDVRFFLRRGRRLAAAGAVAAVAFPLALYAGPLPVLPHVAWGAGIGGALGCLLSPLRRRVAALSPTALGAVGGALGAAYALQGLLGGSIFPSAAAAAALAVALSAVGRRRGAAPAAEDPDVAEAQRVERLFLARGDVAALAAHVAVGLARAGVEEGEIARVLRVVLSYRDLRPSPFAPGLVARLVEAANRRRRRRHLERVYRELRRYL